MAEYRKFKCPYGDDFEGGDECDRCEQYELCMETYPPVNLIEIPEGATNGDMIKAMFSTDYTHIYDRSVSSWWNAPYKGVK